MPYLNSGVKASLDDGRLPMAPGELNYMISKMVDDYITRKGLSYNTLNEVIGAMQCAQLELYRCVAAPYEDYKCRENGGVYLNAK